LILLRLFSSAALLLAIFACWRARQVALRLERLTESYWELRYEHGQLRARVTRLEPAEAISEPHAGKVAFVPLSSLIKR
jgi:cell division protein FtsB